MYAQPNNTFGGTVLVQRVRNTAADRAVWEASATARYGYPIRIIRIPGSVDVHDEFNYVILDISPRTPAVSRLIGMSVGISPDISSSIKLLSNSIRTKRTDFGSPIPTFGKPVVMSGLMQMSAIGAPGGDEYYAALAAPVFDDDSTEYALVTVNALDAFTTGIAAVSPHVVVSLTDYAGLTWRIGGCAHSDSVTNLATEAFVSLNASLSYRLDIGRCPSYSAEFITSKRYVVFASAIAGTAGFIILCLIVWRGRDKRLSMLLEHVHAEERIKAQQLVVGYICHELRNPLHIVRTAYQTVVAELVRLTGKYEASSSFRSHSSATEDGDEDEDLVTPPTEDEMKSMLQDGKSALAQMQATVNDVLDYRSLEHGISSLKLNKQPIKLSKASLVDFQSFVHYINDVFTLPVLLCAHSS